MSDVFISYSRNDLRTAEKVIDALGKDNLTPWIDWKSIPKGEEFEREIQQGIEGSDVFLFLVSPDSIQSNWCNKEITHAVKNGKRILPIVIRETEEKFIPFEISKRNWIFYREGQDDFNTALGQIKETIHADYEWLKYHTKLQVRALEWGKSNNENSFLLRGKELQDAEFQLATNSSKQPNPTDLQRNYVLKSRQATDRQRRITTGITSAGLVVSIVCIIIIAVLAVFGFVQARLANTQTNLALTAQANAESNQALAEERATLARAGELAAQSIALRDSQFDLSLLFSIQAFRTADIPQTKSNLLESAQAKLVFH